MNIIYSIGVRIISKGLNIQGSCRKRRHELSTQIQHGLNQTHHPSPSSIVLFQRRLFNEWLIGQMWQVFQEPFLIPLFYTQPWSPMIRVCWFYLLKKWYLISIATSQDWVSIVSLAFIVFTSFCNWVSV